jgi:hypothetical protein
MITMPDRREFLGAVAGVAAAPLLPPVAPQLALFGIPLVYVDNLDDYGSVTVLPVIMGIKRPAPSNFDIEWIR